MDQRVTESAFPYSVTKGWLLVLAYERYLQLLANTQELLVNTQELLVNTQELLVSYLSWHMRDNCSLSAAPCHAKQVISFN